MAETHTTDPLAAFTLTDKQTILDKLRMIQRSGCLLTVMENGARAGVASVILKVIPEKGVIALEAVANKERSRRLIAAHELQFRAVAAWMCVSRLVPCRTCHFNGGTRWPFLTPTALVCMQRPGAWIGCPAPAAGDRPV